MRHPNEQSVGDGSSTNGVQTDRRTDIAALKEEELGKAIASLEEERSLVVETKRLLHEEQERRRHVSEQLAIANQKVHQAQESYRETQARLAEEKEQTRKVDEKLRTTNVLRLSDRQEKEKVEADRDRYKDIVQDMTSKRLLAAGTNIQAKFPTLLEVQANIRRALTVSVSEWIEDASQVLHPSIVLQDLLVELFHSCQDVVERYHCSIGAFFLGRMEPACEDSDADMDEATARDMLQYMRRHYQTCFPVSDVQLEKERRGILLRLAGDVDREASVRHLIATGMEKLVEEYLLVFVGVLLHPSVELAIDCGTENVFDPKLHAESIDGDDVGAGDKCVVVFPALMNKVEGEGLRPLNKKYILPLFDA